MLCHPKYQNTKINIKYITINQLILRIIEPWFFPYETWCDKNLFSLRMRILCFGIKRKEFIQIARTKVHSHTSMRYETLVYSFVQIQNNKLCVFSIFTISYISIYFPMCVCLRYLNSWSVIQKNCQIMLNFYGKYPLMWICIRRYLKWKHFLWTFRDHLKPNFAQFWWIISDQWWTISALLPQKSRNIKLIVIVWRIQIVAHVSCEGSWSCNYNLPYSKFSSRKVQNRLSDLVEAPFIIYPKLVHLNSKNIM